MSLHNTIMKADVKLANGDKDKVVQLSAYANDDDAEDLSAAYGEMPSSSDEERFEAVAEILENLPDGIVPFSDVCNGYVFSETYRSTLAYCPEDKTFLYYDGTRWCHDDAEYMFTRQLATSTAEAVYCCILQSDSYTKSDIKAAEKLQNVGKINGMLNMAKSYLCIHKDEFDRNPTLLNVQNGTIELLDTGYTFREHRSADYITMCADASYFPKARSELFEKFLSTTMCANSPTSTTTDQSETSEKVDYLQRIAGYILTGRKNEDCFFIFWGEGRNGKGVFLDTLTSCMGDYAIATDPKTLTAGQSARPDSANENVAALCGRRLITASEPEKGMLINEAFIKSATGRDRISARHIYKGMFSFRMEGAFLVNTNHLPIVSDTTIFSTGRTILVDFSHTFSEAEQDKSLREKLSTDECKSAVLLWALDGYNKQLEHSIKNMPQSCQDALDRYRKMTDNVGIYANTALKATSDVSAFVTTTEAYHDYTEWCKCDGYHQVIAEDFKNGLRKLGMEIKRITRKGRGKETVIVGFSLNRE